MVVSAVLLAAVTYAGPGKAKNANQGEKVNEIISLHKAIYVECIGDTVVLSGYLHHVASIRTDENGGIHVQEHWSPRHVRGEGVTTGIKYKGVGATNYAFNGREPYPYTETYVNSFRLIAPGPGNDFHTHVVTHTTVNADGEVTAEIDEERITCGEGG